LKSSLSTNRIEGKIANDFFFGFTLIEMSEEVAALTSPYSNSHQKSTYVN